MVILNKLGNSWFFIYCCEHPCY